MTQDIMYAPNENESTKGIVCSKCQERFHYYDELVFLLNDEQVHVDEQYPDWDDAICTTCAEEAGLI